MANRELEPIFLLLLLLPTLSKTLLAHLEGMELSETGLFPKGVRIQEFFFAWINYLICQHLFKNIQWMSTMMCSSAVLKGWVYIRENVDEFGEEDVTGKCCSFSVVRQSELLLSQKQRKGLALPEMRRVWGEGERRAGWPCGGRELDWRKSLQGSEGSR